ncbi:hypothetical protein [Exiguobacterium sp. R-17]|uniref:hypothetical protein n=1 Tax=Exiguobacterium sp. R-17 TaxID=3404054 RepID=UPI003CEF4BBD
MTTLRDSLFKSEGDEKLRRIAGMDNVESIIPMGGQFAVIGKDAQILNYMQFDQNGSLNIYDVNFKETKQINSVSDNQFQFYDSSGSISNTVFLNDLGDVSYDLDFSSYDLSSLSDSLIDSEVVMNPLADIIDIL